MGRVGHWQGLRPTYGVVGTRKACSRSVSGAELGAQLSLHRTGFIKETSDETLARGAQGVDKP